MPKYDGTPEIVAKDTPGIITGTSIPAIQRLYETWYTINYLRCDTSKISAHNFITPDNIKQIFFRNNPEEITAAKISYIIGYLSKNQKAKEEYLQLCYQESSVTKDRSLYAALEDKQAIQRFIDEFLQLHGKISVIDILNLFNRSAKMGRVLTRCCKVRLKQSDSIMNELFQQRIAEADHSIEGTIYIELSVDDAPPLSPIADWLWKARVTCSNCSVLTIIPDGTPLARMYRDWEIGEYKPFPKNFIEILRRKTFASYAVEHEPSDNSALVKELFGLVPQAHGALTIFTAALRQRKVDIVTALFHTNERQNISSRKQFALVCEKLKLDPDKLGIKWDKVKHEAAVRRAKTSPNRYPLANLLTQCRSLAGKYQREIAELAWSECRVSTTQASIDNAEKGMVIPSKQLLKALSVIYTEQLNIISASWDVSIPPLELLEAYSKEQNYLNYKEKIEPSIPAEQPLVRILKQGRYQKGVSIKEACADMKINDFLLEDAERGITRKTVPLDKIAKYYNYPLELIHLLAAKQANKLSLSECGTWVKTLRKKHNIDVSNIR